MPTAAIFPNELEFFENIQSTQKICACVSQKDCVGVITAVTFAENVPQYIRDQIQIVIDDKIASITNNLSNTNNPSQPLFNYEVEIGFQKPLITTNETADKVMAEHVEKLKNDVGIKAVEEVLANLEKQFPIVAPPKPVPTKVQNITNPLVVGTEITNETIAEMKDSYTTATDILKSIELNYFRPDYKNINNSNDINYVNKDFTKFKEVYNNDIVQTLTDLSKTDINDKITIINEVINTNINAVSYTNAGPTATPVIRINFNDVDKFTIKTNLVEINNILVGVYTAYVSEYDNGILTEYINNLDTTIDQCS